MRSKWSTNCSLMGVRGSSSFFLSSVTSVLKIIFKPIFDLIYDVIKQNKTWEGGKKKEKEKLKALPCLVRRLATSPNLRQY